APGLDKRDRLRSLELAQKAVKLSPDPVEFYGTLGIARYQTGDWNGAKADLKKALDFLAVQAANEFWNQAADGFFLAMALWKLDEKDEARNSYDKAVECMKKHPGDTSYLERYRMEAAKLLGLEKKD